MRQLNRTLSVEHTADRVELAELNKFRDGWLASDAVALEVSLTPFVGHRGYGLYKLQVDLDHRFAITCQAPTATSRTNPAKQPFTLWSAGPDARHNGTRELGAGVPEPVG